MTIKRQKPEFTSGGSAAGKPTEGTNLTHWKCGECSFTFSAATPPEECPDCGEKCDFKNITCYTPDCGGPGNIDSRL
jgi:rubrerythrin